MRGEFVDLNGVQLYYYAAGTRGAGEPVVFLHGFATSGHLWSEVVPLVPAGHRAVVVDLLGYGRSDRPGTNDVSVLGHAARLAQLFDALRIERAGLVGHDMGAAVAEAFAIMHPARVSHVCLVSSAGLSHWPPRALSLLRWLPARIALSALRWLGARRFVDAERGHHAMDVYLRPFEGPEG